MGWRWSLASVIHHWRFLANTTPWLRGRVENSGSALVESSYDNQFDIPRNLSTNFATASINAWTCVQVDWTKGPRFNDRKVLGHHRLRSLAVGDRAIVLSCGPSPAMQETVYCDPGSRGKSIISNSREVQKECFDVEFWCYKCCFSCNPFKSVLPRNYPGRWLRRCGSISADLFSGWQRLWRSGLANGVEKIFDVSFTFITTLLGFF